MKERLFYTFPFYKAHIASHRHCSYCNATYKPDLKIAGIILFTVLMLGRPAFNLCGICWSRWAKDK